MEPVTLRPAPAEDAPLLLSLIHRAFEEYRPLLNPPSGAHRETVETVRDKVTGGGAIIAWSGKEAAGCVLYAPQENAVYLGRLAVLPEYRKQGVGHLLVEAVEGQARILSLAKVTLGVRVQLPGNRAFFECLGYQVTGYYSHNGHAEPTYMTLEKAVGSAG